MAYNRQIQQRHERAVQATIEIMLAAPSAVHTVDELAESVYYSKFHFSRCFLAVTGTSPARYLQRVRITEAKRLLLSTSMSVTEITHEVGYTSVGTFSSRFKDMVGVSPTEYRRGVAVLELTEDQVAEELDRLTEEGVLIVEEGLNGKMYRSLKAVCLRCNMRITNALGCYKPASKTYICPRCERDQLCFEGYVNTNNPEHDNFDRVWEYACDRK